MDINIPTEKSVVGITLKQLSQSDAEYRPPSTPFPLFDETLFHNVPFGKQMKEKNFLLEKDAIFLSMTQFVVYG
jgi:hypothetical protein